jgi:hypothetical protein
MKLVKPSSALLVALVMVVAAAHGRQMPRPEREFRAAWVATVDNIDFPTRKALTVDASLWVKAARLLSPRVKVSRGKDFVRAVWTGRGRGKPFWFVVYVEDESGWSYSVLPAAEKSIALSADRKVRKVLVTAVDRLGNESPLSK